MKITALILYLGSMACGVQAAIKEELTTTLTNKGQEIQDQAKATSEQAVQALSQGSPAEENPPETAEAAE